MPLSDAQRAALAAAAAERGLDEAQLVAAAERLGEEGGEAEPVRPLADRLLIGFLPFIKVVELRSLWLGLPERIPDDEMTCGDYQMKHGGDAGTGAAEAEE